MILIISIALCSSLALAATIDQVCKPNCMKDCTDVGNGDVGGTNCVMVFGTGSNGLGWYGSDDNGNDQLGTCRESCEAVCELMCTPRGEGSDDGQEADDRWLAYRGYGRRGGYGGY